MYNSTIYSVFFSISIQILDGCMLVSTYHFDLFERRLPLVMHLLDYYPIGALGDTKNYNTLFGFAEPFRPAIFRNVRHVKKWEITV